MKTVILRGGLGNQLFGLAFADTIGHLSFQPVRLDLSAYHDDPHDRRFETAELAQDFRVSFWPDHSGIARRPGQFTRGRRHHERIREPLETTDIHGLRGMATDGLIFDGYWQDEAWFARPDFIRERTRAFLDARAPAAPIHDVVVHYRSYREERVPGRREGPSALYVSRALDQVAERLGRTRDMVLVSDNPALALGRLGKVGERLTVCGGSPASDMALMLSARCLVLANSSFSWWAGYCGDATFVTYPARLGHFHYPSPAKRFRLV